MKKLFLINPITQLVFLLLCTIAVCANAQVVAIEENFDSVTLPSLPSDWSSVSLQGSNTAKTVNTASFSSPNSAFIADPSTTTLTALVTRPYSIVTSLPTTNVYVTFKHKRGFENFYDGGVLEVSINGSAFADVKSPSIGGSFGAGDYNLPNLSAGNPLGARNAWSGTSASFESVSLTIPNIPDNSVFGFQIFTRF
jgi:hypothetical protein